MWLHSIILALGILIPSSRAGPAPPNDELGQWSGWGANHFNNRWASKNRQISSSNIKSLESHCKIRYGIGVSATPVLSGNVVYYPTWSGAFVALDYTTCHVLWQINVTDIISAYAPISAVQLKQTKPVSRTSPQVDGDVVYFGTMTHALVVAVDRSTGKTLGTMQINPHPLAVLTMAPTFFDGKIFIGSSSLEESAPSDPAHPCCSFIGNFASVSFDKNKKAFRVNWNATMIPEVEAKMGWSGVAIWGSQPSIDTGRRQVFIATGNTYSVPDVIIACQDATENITAIAEGLVPDPCLPRDILQESIIAFDLDLGIMNWVHQLPALDAWTTACGIPAFGQPRRPLECPETPGPDADFGMAPTFVPGSPSTPYGKDLVVVGQKSGILYGISAQAGQLFWSKATSPGGVGGGLSWGVAADDSRAYFTAINTEYRDWHTEPSNQLTNRSAFGAVSLSNGTLLWETPTPGNGISYSPPSIVGDLVLVGKTGTDPKGNQATDRSNGSLIALEKSSGKVLLELVQDTNFHGGVAIQDRYVLFGLGYGSFSPPPNSTGSINVLRLAW